MREFDISSLAYTEILSAWEIRGGENIGILGTALPKTFVVRASRITRWNVSLQVILAVTAALLLGISLSRHITLPILRLKNAASEISRGNLEVEVETKGTDEVAVLAKAFDEMAFSLRRSEKSLIAAYDRTIEGWVKALELRDRETLGHTLRVANLTIRLARLMNIEEGEMENIRRGVLLHDIGKMGIPDNILLKQGPLEDWERKIIEKHPALAREMLSQIEFLHPCIDIPSCHHERWDGRGYPDGLLGEEIPLTARIFAVIDVWDALTSDRPYRKAWSMDAALQYVRKNAGKHFDPQVVQVFLQWIKSDDLDRYEEKTVPASVLVHDKPE
jgi:putative nucleotidyltransferase with HDIG domain